MRRFTLLLPLAFLSASAPTHAKKHEDRPRERAQPREASKPKPACPSAKSGVRVFGRDGTLTLVATKDGLVSPSPCCVPKAKLRLLPLTSVGDPLEPVDATVEDCAVTNLETTPGRIFVEGQPTDDGDGVLPSPKEKRRRLRQVPLSKTALERLGSLVDDVTNALLAHTAKPCPNDEDRLPLKARTLSFEPDDRTEPPTAVVGGHLLVVATLGGTAKNPVWTVRHLEVAGSDRCTPRAYQPLAAFDADASSSPELFVLAPQHNDQGLLVLSRDGESFNARWRHVAGPH